MKISEVMKDSKIKIHGSVNGHGILFITKAAIGVRDGLLVDSLTYFDEDIVLRDPARIVAVNKRDGRTYEFKSEGVGPVETKYGKYHLIRCSGEASAADRRRSERYDIDRLGIIRINRGGDMRNALVYDISMKGIALILDSDAVCKVGDHILASFRYDPDYFHFYNCEATVVRVFTINDQIAVGCSIETMGADLITLISNKKKESAGIPIEDFLGIESSPDSDVASGAKIPVNYSPPLHKPELLDAEENESEDQYLTPEEAADIIPERSRSEIIEERSIRVEERSIRAEEKSITKPSESTPVAPPEGPVSRNLAVDERLFAKGNGDGFLTPEQIADIIELERIHRNDMG